MEHVLTEQAKQKRERLQAVRDAGAAAESALGKTPAKLAKAVEEATERAEEARAGAGRPWPWAINRTS